MKKLLINIWNFLMEWFACIYLYIMSLTNISPIFILVTFIILLFCSGLFNKLKINLNKYYIKCFGCDYDIPIKNKETTEIKDRNTIYTVMCPKCGEYNHFVKRNEEE